MKGYKLELHVQACSTQAASTMSPHTDRDREDGHQRSNSFSGPLRRTISEPNVSGLSRPVVNLNALNELITHKKFKAHLLRDLLHPGNWMASINLEDTYLCDHGPTRSEIALVQWAGTAQMYDFQCLPFGLSSAPRVLTKLLKPAASEGPPSDIVPGHVADISRKSS